MSAGWPCPAGSFCATKSLAPIPCSAGSYCSAQVSAGQACQSGTICASSGLSSPLDCPAGFYCQGNFITAVTGPCRAGYFCSNASALPTGTGACAGGTYCPPGSSSFLGAGECAPGFFCRSGSDRQQCKPGTYCPAASAEPQPCPPGSYCPDDGMNATRDCNAGAYCRTAGLSAPTGLCLGGYFCRSGTVSPTANECPPGSLCPPGSSAPVACPTGFYCATAALSSVTGACVLNQLCPTGSVKPTDSCPAGFYCVDSSTTVECPRGAYCPAASSAPTLCPAGSICPQTGRSAPTACPGGAFCNATGLLAETGRCGIGQLCPPGSAAAQPCPAGFVCGAVGMSIAVGCPVGQSCNATSLVATCRPGTYAFGNSSECKACPDGLRNPSAGQSPCLACSLGSFAASPMDAVCTPCAPSSWCLFGGAAPISRAILDNAAASGSFNPFKHAIEANSAGLTRFLIALGCLGAGLVVLILATATAAHLHPRARRLVLGDTPDRAQMWAALGIMFSFVHFTPKGSVMRRRGTSFGGMVSLACSVAIVVLSAMLATKNLLNPNYIQSVSADALAANPTGTFRLRARVFGGGAAFASACDGMGIAPRAGDAAGWIHFGVSNGAANATRPAVASFDANGRACLLEWRCEQCQLSGSVSSTVLSLRSTLPSWATYVNFTFEAPSFVIAGATPTAAPVAATASSGIGGAGEPFSTYGSISPQPVALRGVDAAATQVAISLIGVDAQTQSGERAAAFSALVGSIVIPTAVAATTDAASFDFGSGIGFQIDFVVQRSQTVIVWFVGARIQRMIDDGAVFNVVVLIGSLISTVVVAFTIIMRTLEEYCRISTSEPNKHVIGDQTSTTASSESVLSAEKASGGAGHDSVGAVSSSSFNQASSGYADFDSASDRGGVRDTDETDDGRVQGALPFHGNVIFQASSGVECAIEMHRVQNLPPIISAAPTAAIASRDHDQHQQHQHHERTNVADRDSQMMAMLSRLAERSESQHAALIAQVARSEIKITALVGELAALRYENERKFELQDQK